MAVDGEPRREAGATAPAADDGPAAPAARPGPVVLVGFMGAGKSTVGPLLADRLGGRFVDLDREVERLAGRTIPEIFRRGGESRFRALEARVTEALEPEPGLVVAAGGGWMARPDLRRRWPAAVRVWLRVSPEEMVRRLTAGAEGRPMLDPEDPEGSARRLLALRRKEYARAELHVDTDGLSPVAVAREVERALRRFVGAPGGRAESGTAGGEDPPGRSAPDAAPAETEPGAAP